MTKIVLTTHAVERMWQRRISQGMIEKTVQKPDGKKKESDGDTQFYRTLVGLILALYITWFMKCWTMQLKKS